MNRKISLGYICEDFFCHTYVSLRVFHLLQVVFVALINIFRIAMVLYIVFPSVLCFEHGLSVVISQNNPRPAKMNYTIQRLYNLFTIIFRKIYKSIIKY